MYRQTTFAGILLAGIVDIPRSEWSVLSGVVT